MKNEIKSGSCMKPEQILDMLTGAVDIQHKREFELHVSECDACRSEFEGYLKAADVIRKEESGAVCDVVDLVMARIASEKKYGTGGSESIPFTRLVLRIAAVIAVAFVFGLMMRTGTVTDDLKGSGVDLAVKDAAVWLVSVQDRDGSWAPEKWGGRRELSASLTGLAVMTILKSEVPAEAALCAAERYLVSLQNDDGGFGPDCVGNMYNHGIAMQALLALRKAGKGTAQEEIERGLAYIKRSQLPAGGWSYREADSRNSSIGVSVWQIGALAAARDADMGGVDQSLRKGMYWLKGAYEGADDFLYGQGNMKADMSTTVKAMGAMCMLSAGREVLGSFDSGKVKQLFVGSVGEDQADDVYQSYFVASAAAAGGFAELDRNIEKIRSDITGRRLAKGINAGSWDASGRWGNVGGRIYSTSMAALSLSSMRREGT